MLAWSGMTRPIKAQRIELGGEESQLSNGVHSCISGKGWSNHVFQNLQSGTRQKGGEREASRRGFHIPRLKAGMDELLGSTPKKYASRYFQLKVGHGAIGKFLAKIGVVETPECWWCREAEQSVDHSYVHKVSEVEETKEEAHKKLKRKKL